MSLFGFTATVVAQEQTLMNFYNNIEGNWQGTYSLWLSPESSAEKSNIEATIESVAKGKYFVMTYSWKRSEKEYEGVFLLGGNGTSATATWGDSFHMAPEPMQCKGELDDGKLLLNGSYGAGSGPDWGWRTEFIQLDSKNLIMKAYNITPTGEEALAVRAELKRVIKPE